MSKKLRVSLCYNKKNKLRFYDPTITYQEFLTKISTTWPDLQRFSLQYNNQIELENKDDFEALKNEALNDTIKIVINKEYGFDTKDPEVVRKLVEKFVQKGEKIKDICYYIKGPTKFMLVVEYNEFKFGYCPACTNPVNVLRGMNNHLCGTYKAVAENIKQNNGLVLNKIDWKLIKSL